jgi:phytoene dehydrogenase-like protein
VIDALIVGAGAAGLIAAKRLRAARKRVVVVEARERPGGRIHTAHDRFTGCPIEQGAEFVHGGAPALMREVKAARLRVGEIHGHHYWRDRDGRVGDTGESFGRAIGRLAAAGEFDGSVAEWLRKAPREEREIGMMFVRGFHAAERSGRARAPSPTPKARRSSTGCSTATTASSST